MRSLAFLVLAVIGFNYVNATSKLQVKVLDDVTGEPIQNALVRFYFVMGNGWKAWTESAKDNVVDVVTDSDGWCKASEISNEGESGAYVVKAPDGYYKASCGSVKYKRHSLFRIWQPDDIVLTGRLQRVEHPIPLFVKNVLWYGGMDNKPIISNNEYATLSFDFLQGDFLPPFGYGEHADMNFNMRILRTVKEVLSVTGKLSEMNEMELSIEFENEGDGLKLINDIDQKQDLKIRTATEYGYNRITKRLFGRRKKAVNTIGQVIHESYKDVKDSRCYTFRIRTKYNEKGEIVGGYYGKIYGDFDFEASGKRGLSSMRFLYYLNPTPLDTNLEWDMKTNLNPNSRSLNTICP